jgi:2-(3-amino-3-carboxypropyl)histidine synthase
VVKSLAFDLEEKRLIEEIKQRKAKRVLIQLPEGLKNEGCRLAALAEKAGAVAIVSADPCYGACDLANLEAEILCTDLLIHYGHTKMIRENGVPIIYVKAKASIDVKEAIIEAMPYLECWKSIGLTTTAQHVHTLDDAMKLLLDAGKTVAIGDVGQLKYAGQVIGCNYSNAKSIAKDVEAFLFIGGGRFHALGLALATKKPTVIADPYENVVCEITGEVEKTLKQRWASICEAKKAKKFGILIGIKNGQRRIEKAMKIKNELERNGKTAILLAAREETPEVLMQFPSIDAFINTACPRLSLDDASRFLKPVILPNETSVMLGKMAWEDLCKESWFES